jgi:anti-sigma regulatory factor (Ser/Thr protein kinase)
MTETLCITRAAELETLGVFRDFIAQACARSHIDADTSYALQLAMDEASTNVIQHGYAGTNPGSLMLDLKIEPKQVVMKITDFGRPFEPYEPEAPDGAPEDGDTSAPLFSFNTMDSVDYCMTEEGNCLI